MENQMDSGRLGRVVTFAIAFVMFSFGLLVVWFGTNEALLKKMTSPRVVEFSSEGIGFVLMLAATWLIYRKCK